MIAVSGHCEHHKDSQWVCGQFMCENYDLCSLTCSFTIWAWQILALSCWNLTVLSGKKQTLLAMMYASLHPPLFLPQCTNDSGTGTSSDNMPLFIYFLQCSRVQSLSSWSGIKSSSRPQDITRFFKKEKLLTAPTCCHLKFYYLSNGRILTICFIPGGDFFFSGQYLFLIQIVGWLLEISLFSFQRHSVSLPCFIQSWTPCAFCGCVCWRKHLVQYPHALSSLTRVTVISVVVKTVNVYITDIMPSNPETLIFNIAVNTHECCFLTGIHCVMSF